MESHPLWTIRGTSSTGGTVTRRMRAPDHGAAVAAASSGGLGFAPLKVWSCTLVDESPDATRRRAAAAWHQFQAAAGSL